MFWGASEALDFVEEYQKKAETTPDSLNILLYGPGDPRHIIKTAAKSYNHDVKVNFYIVDGCIEIVARNLALLAIALESSNCLSLQQKTHLFMDVYGNALLRPSSFQYLASKANTLLKICCDSGVREQLAPIFDIEMLKYRERDGLENAFNFWLPKTTNQFNIQKYWEARNRSLLKTRYDFRDGAFDWDLQMCLKERGAKQLCTQEYKTWRHTGVAFTYPEYEQCHSNRTLAAGLIRNGNTYINRGYVGDIEVGPFCAFGLTTSEEYMLRSCHGDNDYRATDVTERNLMELFHELETKTKYVHDKSISRRLGSVVIQEGKNFTGHENESTIVAEYNDPMIHLPNVKVYFLSMDEVFGLQDGSKWKKFFNAAFVSYKYFNFLKPSFVDIFQDSSLIYFETYLYTVYRKEVVAKFEEQIREYAKKAEMNCVTNLSVNVKYPIFKYKLN